MKIIHVVHIIEQLASNPDNALDIDQVHALIFAVALIRALPPSLTSLGDVILELAHPTLSP